PGLLSFIHCATPSECSINYVCVEKSEGCEGYTSPLKNPNHCKTKGADKPCTKVRHNGGSGFIRCVADGIDQIKPFDENGLRTGKDQPMKLNLTIDGVVVEDELRRFSLTLLRSPYHFIEGQRWSITYNNGTDVQVEDVLAESESNLSRHKVLTQIKIPKSIENPLKIICRVPFRDSMDWKVISVDIASNEAQAIERIKEESLQLAEIDITTFPTDPDLQDDAGEVSTTLSSSPHIEFV
ncbi:unnamed protein product, partial [Allacma fusca]